MKNIYLIIALILCGQSILFGQTDEANCGTPAGVADEFDLYHIGTYATGRFDESAAEIVAFDDLSGYVYFTNADANSIAILDISNPLEPTLVNEINMDVYGGGVNSVAVYNGIVAAAVEGEEKTDPGVVVIMDTVGQVIIQAPVGALPDMLTFSPDGNKIVVANEGEPNDDYSIDPEGSISILDLSTFSVTNVTFESYNDRRVSLENRGIRIFGPNATVAQDLEPEYVAITPDSRYAYVTLQENNAFALVDLESKSLVDLLPLGYKDHNSGSPILEEYILNEVVEDYPALGLPVYEGADTVMLGGFSGLYFDQTQSTDTSLVFYAVPDRGPNDDAVAAANVLPRPPKNLRPYKLPNYQARIVKFTLNRATGVVTLDEQVMMTRQDGTTPISGTGNVPGYDEVPVTFTDSNTIYTNTDFVDTASGVAYHQLAYDAYAGDFEGIVKDSEGYFWMCDENRPAIYKVDTNGVLVERYVPEGTSLLGTDPQAPGFYGAETLPAVYSNRRANRGFEAIAYEAETDLVYAFIQSPMDNPSRNNTDVIRVLAIEASSGLPQAEYVYLLDRNMFSGYSSSRVDKIGDAVCTGKGQFLVVERDSEVPGNDGSQKFVYKMSLVGATNILGTALSNASVDSTLEQMSADDLAAAGIQAVKKTKAFNPPSIGYLPSDKIEGIAYLNDGSIALLNDNDFGLAGAGVTDNSILGIVSFCSDYGLDASDDKDYIDIKSWPVLGTYMPDAAAAFSYENVNYIVTVNEGDAREYDTFEEEARVADLELDSAAYPNAAAIQEDTELGRLKTTLTQGDYDGDGDFDQIYTFGGRSFSIFDAFGNLVYDSGDDFAQILVDLDSTVFNSTNDDNDSFKNRSDDKGTEPEAVRVVELDGDRYALIGLERQGGIMVYNISVPQEPYFVSYVNNRNFDVEATTAEAGDLGVECIEFIAADQSPTGFPLVITANEVSGTVSIFGVNEMLSGTSSIIESDGQLSVYPNPTSGIVSVEWDYDRSVRTINLFDVYGRQVLQTPPDNQTLMNINLGELQNGIYFLQLLDQENNPIGFRKILKR